MVEEYVATRNSNQIKNYALKEYGTLTFAKSTEKQTENVEVVKSNIGSLPIVE